MSKIILQIKQSILSIILLILFASNINAQALTGSKIIPSTLFPTIKVAVDSLNSQGVGSGGVVFNIAAGYTETISATIAVTATGTATNQIVFQKDPLTTGANPLITAYVGTLLSSSTLAVDGMWSFTGSDYVTVDGIDLLDPTSNTTATTTMEFGYGFYKASAIDGANYNTVKNCNITLSRENFTAATGPRWHGSVAIELAACTPAAVGTTITQTSVSGASSFNKFYKNTIQNCNGGIAIGGAAIASPYTIADLNNDIGGSSTATGNTIINFGGGVGATNACMAAWASNQWSFNISYNTVNNNNGLGANHPATNRGIFAAANSVGASATINFNNVTIIGGTNAGAIDWGIDCEMAQSGAAGNTVSVNYNTISMSKTVASTVAFTAIWMNSAPTTVNIIGNNITNFTCLSTSASEVGVIRCGGPVAGTLNINNNTIGGVNFNAATGTDYIIGVTTTVLNALNITGNNINGVTITGATSKILRSIYVSTAVATCANNISNDTFQNYTYSGGTPTGEFSLIYALGTTLSYNINNNRLIGGLMLPSSGATYLIYNSQSTPNVTVSGNSLSGTGINRTGASGTFYAYYNFGSPGVGTINIVNNSCANITLNGTSAFDGFEHRTSTSQTIRIINNTVSNINGGTGVKYGIYQGYGAVGSAIYNNNIYGLSGGGIIYGIFVGSVAPLGMDCFGNKVDSITATGTGIAYGIYNSLGGGVTSIYKNKINNIINNNAAGSAIGLHINGGTTFNIHNNLIGNIGAPTSSGTNQAIGLNIIAGTTHNIYFNTINLNAVSTGAIFGTSAISVNATPTTIVLRNNIITNTSIANSTGLTVAYRRASNVLTNYSTLSNNNLFYAGTPSANNLIFNDGTNSDQTVSAFKSRLITFEQASFTENPTFISTTGSNNGYLHLNLLTPTQCESGGTNISGFPYDYDSIIRQGNTSYTGTGSNPDVGADEGEFIGILMSLDSSNVDQVATAVPLNSTNQQVVAIRVYASNNFNALNVTSLKLNTAGTTNVNDIQNAKVFYTGSSPVFSSATQYGSTVAIPNGNFYVTGSRALSSGVNYFWVTYDVKSTATANNFIDARVDSIVIGGANSAPLNGNPTGARKILVSLSGNFNVGVGQTYVTITSAMDDIKSLGVSGPVVFTLKDALYNSTSGEVFPIVFNSYLGSSSTNTVTIRPDFGNISRVESSNATATFDLNGISNLIIDGRLGGTGTFVAGNNLTIVNTNAAAPAIRFINEASANKILYADLRSNNITAPGTLGAGVVNFGTTTGLNGNDNNIIRYCDIHEDGLSNPTIGISSIGSITSVATNNDNNIIDSCNIYNYFNPTIATAGIYVGANNGSWTINANKFYQTVSVTTTGTQSHRAMWITPNTASLTSASGFIITNNYIGGNASNGTGTFTMNGTSAYQYLAMDISVGIGTATSIQNNTITNFAITTGFSGNGIYGINVANGNVNVGTITGNLFGSTTTNGAFTYTTTTTNGGIIPLRSGAGGTINFSNNIVSGVDLISSSTTSFNVFNGIAGSGGANIIINNNTIGSTTLVNSINMISTSATATAASTLRGIICNSATAGVVNTITNNIVSNLNSNYAATGTQATNLVGISVTTGTSTVTGNIIRNLTSATQTTAGGNTSAIVGISYTSTTAPAVISNNKINNLVLTGVSTTAAVQCEGLFYSGPTTGTNIISKNIIHSLSLNAVNPTVYLTAMDIGAGLVTIANNMMRLGYDSLGNSITTPCFIRGISKNVAITNVYFNSIYIGGTGVGANATNTFAFQRTASATSDDVRNNIFMNDRSNASSGGKHYQCFLINNTTITLNNNIYYGSGTGAVFGTLNNGTSDVTTYSSGWTSTDANSAAADPQFVNATGTAALGDIHISSTSATPIESSGVIISSITDDIDGQIRSNFSATDIGADAGNFLPLDIFAPVIANPNTSNSSSTADRILNINITDFTGVPTTSSNEPRIYFKKSFAGSYSSTSAVRTSGNAQNGQWNFTISQSAMGGLTLGDSVYFYLVAQDSSSATNLSSLPAGAIGTSVNSISTPPNALFSYKIVNGFSGTINVGAGQTYTTLTSAGGLFEAINNGSLNGNITAVVTSDLLEDGTNGINPINETGAGNYTFSIVPDGTTERLIAGSFAGGLIRFNGADRVKIDGRFAGSGRYLRFRNRLQNGYTINFQNDAVRDTITFCHIESVNNTVGTITFLGTNIAGGIGNDSNAITNCIIRDTLGTISTSNIQNTGFFSQGTAGFGNDRNSIINNEIYNFGFNGVNLSTTSGDFWNISNNSFYQNITKNQAMNIMQIDGGTGHNFTGNNFGGSNAVRGGTPFTTSSSINVFRINNAITTAQISNNIFSNIASIGTVNAILVSAGVVNINNNTFGGAAQPYDTIQNGFDNGIINISGGTVNVTNNLIGNVNYYDNAGDRTVGVAISGGTVVARGNTIRDIRSNSSSTSLIYLPTGFYITAGANHDIDSNIIYNIVSTSTGSLAYNSAGIIQNGGTNSIIQRNRIYNVWASGTGTAINSNQVFGMYISNTGNTLVRNNQISIGNNTIGETRVYGIQDVAGSGTNSYYNNSIFINGATIGGSNNSYCLQRTGLVNINSFNNIFFNKRTTTGTGANYTTGSSSLTGISPVSTNYNLYVINDSTKIAESPTGFANSISVFNSLYTGANTYSSNWYEFASAIAPQTLFTDTLVGNLGVVTTNANCWYANGKGLALASVVNDFNNTPRSVSIATGATDIGAVEFTTTTTPIAANASAAPAINTATNYTFANRQVASINWGSVGTVPSTVNVLYYSGINAPNLISNSSRYNAYYNITATGGTAYNYGVSLLADSAQFGNVSGVNNTKIARYTGSNWNLITASNGNGITGNMQTTANTQSVFGVFTGTDNSSNPLPVILTSLVANKIANDVNVSWNTATEINNKGFEVERAIDGKTFEYIGLVKGAGNSNKSQNYQFVDANAFKLFNTSVLYYRLKQVDFDGNFFYSTIVSVNNNDAFANGVSVYPNPFTNEFNISIIAENNNVANIETMDIQGKLVATKLVSTVKGLNIVSMNENSNLHAGIYFVRVTINGEIKTMKLVKN
jgi:hypothetical protein